MKPKPLIPPELLGLPRSPDPSAASPSPESPQPAHEPAAARPDTAPAADHTAVLPEIPLIDQTIWLSHVQDPSAPRLWVASSDTGGQLECHVGPVGIRVELDAQHCLELGALLTLIGLRTSSTPG